LTLPNKPILMQTTLQGYPITIYGTKPWSGAIHASPEGVRIDHVTLTNADIRRGWVDVDELKTRDR
jgi:hypothetical protein